MRFSLILRLITLLGFLGILLPHAASAQTAILPNCEKTVYTVGNELGTQQIFADQYDADTYGPIKSIGVNRKCDFTDFVRLFINIANWAMGILAVLTVLVFIWGGYGLIIAAGRAEKAQQAKSTIIGAFIGLLIVLSAWTLVSFWVTITTGDAGGTVFANTQFARLWSGGESCRFSQNYSTTCPHDDLHEGCGDGRNSTAGPITDAQRLLEQYACDPGPADGCFGPQTKAAVSTFQVANNLIDVPDTPPPNDVEGRIQVNTWEVLQSGGAIPCAVRTF